MNAFWESGNPQHKVGAAVRKDIANQYQDLLKAAHKHNVKPGDLALHILEGRRSDMKNYLREVGLKPISNNVATLAVQISNHLIGSAKNYCDRYEGRDNYCFNDAFDEMMTNHINESVGIENPLHHQNFIPFDGSADETAQLQAAASAGNAIGATVGGIGGEGEAGKLIQSLGAAGAAIPGIGSVLGPIMSVGGSLVGMIGSGKRKKKAEKAAQEARDAALAQQLLLAQKQKPPVNKMILAGGAVAVLILLVVALKS